ncbi:ABC transporter permease [Microvirga sp. VF16]|uniref:ABC transporter permease n=1 Tax=Microvirga sp. VF16 TaxID=2807101 RepID=UPI00193DF7BD|nr:ABC transporter permease [Microvirga sp. VF16]QRM33241.1 ABC transporter permease [Microvirga sp. VF16]
MNMATIEDKLPVIQRTDLPTLLAVGWVLLMLIIALAAPLIAPYEITAIDLRHRLAPPIGFGGTMQHILGTDDLGRDIASRLFYSIRTSLLVAFGATAISVFVGTAIGFVAAYFRGLVEHVLLLMIDVQASLPFLIVALAMLAFFGNSLVLFVCLMGIYGWERNARLARGLAMAAGAQGYASATRQLGAHPLRVYLRHILPNSAATLLVAATVTFPEIVLVESGLSFLGLGVQPPMTSLGLMVAAGREYIARAPWMLLSPSLVIVLTAVAVSVLGDWLRDKLDPTLN